MPLLVSPGGWAGACGGDPEGGFLGDWVPLGLGGSASVDVFGGEPCSVGIRMQGFGEGKSPEPDPGCQETTLAFRGIRPGSFEERPPWAGVGAGDGPHDPLRISPLPSKGEGGTGAESHHCGAPVFAVVVCGVPGRGYVADIGEGCAGGEVPWVHIGDVVEGVVRYGHGIKVFGWLPPLVGWSSLVLRHMSERWLSGGLRARVVWRRGLRTRVAWPGGEDLAESHSE